METANKFELHYYLNNDSHEIDAFIRNKCEAELLAVLAEIAIILNIDAQIIAQATREGGFKEFWKFLSNNGISITILLLTAQLLATTIPLVLQSKSEKLEDELTTSKIEETKLSIEKLKREAKSESADNETAEKISKKLSKSLKIIKRKSNFYSTLSGANNISSIGFSVLNDNHISITNEVIVKKNDFRKFVLKSNKLKAKETEVEIEIISPVLKEGKFKWKGIYQDQVISFDMLDLKFKDSVLLDNIPFKHGTTIICVLRINRELDEVGEVKVTGYSVVTVISKNDDGSSQETQQGKSYRHTKKMQESQGKLFR